jgi:hypothetical protein
MYTYYNIIVSVLYNIWSRMFKTLKSIFIKSENSNKFVQPLNEHITTTNIKEPITTDEPLIPYRWSSITMSENVDKLWNKLGIIQLRDIFDQLTDFNHPCGGADAYELFEPSALCNLNNVYDFDLYTGLIRSERRPENINLHLHRDKDNVSIVEHLCNRILDHFIPDAISTGKIGSLQDGFKYAMIEKKYDTSKLSPQYSDYSKNILVVSIINS